MYNNNFNYGNGMGYGMQQYIPNTPMQNIGVRYPQYGTAKGPAMTQPLSEEAIKTLRQKNQNFSMKVDPIDLQKSICTHKDHDKITLLDNPDGTVTCDICGETFTLLNNADTAQQTVDNMLNILQSIKTFYVDMPKQYAEALFNMIPWIKKMPELLKIAMNNYSKYEEQGMFNTGYMYPNMNASSMFNNIMAGNNMPYYGQPAYSMGMPQQAPMYGSVNPQLQMVADPMLQQQQYGMIPQQPQPQMVAENPFQQINAGYNPVNMPTVNTVAPQVIEQPVVQQPTPQAQPAPQNNTTTATKPDQVQQQKIFQV